MSIIKTNPGSPEWASPSFTMPQVLRQKDGRKPSVPVQEEGQGKTSSIHLCPSRWSCMGTGEQDNSLPSQAKAEFAGVRPCQGWAELRAPVRGWVGTVPSQHPCLCLALGVGRPRDQGCHIPLAGAQENGTNSSQDMGRTYLVNILYATAHALNPSKVSTPLLSMTMDCCLPTASFLPAYNTSLDPPLQP